MILAPLLSYAFFVSLMDRGLPEEMPVGVVDMDGSATSRVLVRNLDAFAMTDVVGRYANFSEARAAMQRGEIYGFFLIPHELGRKAMRRERPRLSFYLNYSYYVAASLTYKDMRTMSELASGAATRTQLYAKGASDELAQFFLQPIVVDTHAIGNPWLNYSVYLNNTIIPGLLGLFVFLITAYSLGTELKDGTAREWLRQAHGSMLLALMGKCLPQFVVFWLGGAAYVFLLYGILSFPCACGIGTMLGVMTLFVLACQGLGVTFFALLPSMRLAISAASLWGILSFSISGMSFPVMAMPAPLQGLSLLFPLRHYFLLYVNCALDGYGLFNASPYVAALLCFFLLPLLLMNRLRRIALYAVYEP